MSIAVPLEDLAGHVAERGPGFLLSSSGAGRPHVLQVRFEVDGPVLRAGVGRSAVRNITAQPAVTLLWPPLEPGGYSLIVDAEGTIEDPAGTKPADSGATAVLTATWAVLHRPA